MVYLFSAFFSLWAITFGYVFSIYARQRRLAQKLELLRQASIDQPADTIDLPD